MKTPINIEKYYDKKFEILDFLYTNQNKYSEKIFE